MPRVIPDDGPLNASVGPPLFYYDIMLGVLDRIEETAYCLCGGHSYRDGDPDGRRFKWSA